MIRRRCGEAILLGDDVEIQVLEVLGSRVKLGISAPRELLVLRKELRQTQKFNRQAALTVPLPRILSLVTSLSAIVPPSASPAGETQPSSPDSVISNAKP
jgi:carbon storage regulator